MRRIAEVSDFRKGQLPDVGAVLSLMLVSLLAFFPELVLGLKLVDGDLYRQVVPVTAWYGRAANSGSDFLWAPGMLGGFPIAFTQYGLLSPLDWIAAKILDPDRAFALNLALHLSLAGIATYAYARVMRLSRLPSLLAGVGYQLSTEALALGIGGYLLRSMFLLPTLLLCVEMIVRGRLRWAVLAAVGIGASLLSGTAYIVAISTVNAGLYTIARGIWLWRKGLRRGTLWLLGSMGGAVVLGTGLAAVRVLPTLGVTGVSVRSGGLPFEMAAAGSTNPALLLAGYLLPITRLEGIGGGDAPSYVGPMVLVLATIAVFRNQRNSVTVTFAGLLLFNLLTSLGSNGPLFQILHQTPLFAAFRTASRFSLFSAFFLSMLAAQMLERERMNLSWGGVSKLTLRVAACTATVLFASSMVIGILWSYGGEPFNPLRDFAEEHDLGPLHPLRPRMILALAAISATMWLLYLRVVGWLPRTTLQFVSVGGTACLLLIVGLVTVQFRSPDPMPPATARFLQGDTSLFRVMSFWPTLSFHHYLSYLAEGDPKRFEQYTPRGREFKYRYMRETLAPNFPLEFGLESIDGFEVLQSTRQAIAMTYLGSDKAEEIGIDPDVFPEGRGLVAKLKTVGAQSLTDRIRVLRAFNVKYVLTNLELWEHSDGLRLAFTSQIPMLDPRTTTSVHVYEVAHVLPRAYLVPDSLVVGNEIEALDAIMSGQVDPSHTVVLEQPGQGPLLEPRLDTSQSSVEVTSYDGSQLTLQMQTSGSGFLVINDSFFLGWRAWVDGVETSIHIANGWVRAVPIEAAGQHTVLLSYIPPLFLEGKLLSLVSLLICLAGLVIPLRRKVVLARS